MARSRSLTVAASLAGLLLLAALGWYLQNRPGSAPVSAPPGPAPQRAQVVETVAVTTRAMPEEVSAVGSLTAWQSVMLRPEEAGRVAQIRFEQGRPVKAGETLVVLDDAVPRARVAQARAALALAESNHRRSEDLYARQYISARARDESASAVQVAAADLAMAQAQLEKTRLLAPFDGVAGIRRVSLGDYVKEGADLVNIEDLSVLAVDFRLPEALVQRVAVDQVLELRSDALPDTLFKARIAAIDPQVDSQGRALVLRARLDNQAAMLRPGLFVRVRLILQERPAVTAVPEAALIPAGQGHEVFRVESGQARQVKVRVGARRDGWVEIQGGLAPGDVVVVAGQQRLRDGLPVQVRQPVEPVAAR